VECLELARGRHQADAGGPDLHRAGQLALPDRVQGQSTGVWAGLRYAIEQGWFWMHESGTYLRLLKQED
jgi:hypothetical protein